MFGVVDTLINPCPHFHAKHLKIIFAGKKAIHNPRVVPTEIASICHLKRGWQRCFRITDGIFERARYFPTRLAQIEPTYLGQSVRVNTTFYQRLVRTYSVGALYELTGTAEFTSAVAGSKLLPIL